MDPLEREIGDENIHPQFNTVWVSVCRSSLDEDIWGLTFRKCHIQNSMPFDLVQLLVFMHSIFKASWIPIFPALVSRSSFYCVGDSKIITNLKCSLLVGRKKPMILLCFWFVSRASRDRQESLEIRVSGGGCFRKLNFPRNVILYFISCKNSWRSQY